MKKVLDIGLVLLVFTLAGSSTAFLSGKIMNLLGAEPWTFTYIAGYILFIFPLYQALTLIYAAMLGKFNFFFSRQKKIALRIKSLFTGKRRSETVN